MSRMMPVQSVPYQAAWRTRAHRLRGLIPPPTRVLRRRELHQEILRRLGVRGLWEVPSRWVTGSRAAAIQMASRRVCARGGRPRDAGAAVRVAAERVGGVGPGGELGCHHVHTPVDRGAIRGTARPTDARQAHSARRDLRDLCLRAAASTVLAGARPRIPMVRRRFHRGDHVGNVGGRSTPCRSIRR
jgi:hypothetical protein